MTDAARFLARRVAWTVFVVWAVVSLTFVLNDVLPSDPALMVAGAQARPADIAKIRAQLGLDRPLSVQYAAFLRRLVHVGPALPAADSGAKPPPDHASCLGLGPLHVDLGKSYQQRRAVVVILGERLPRTLYLAAAAIVVQIVLGGIAGVVAARRRGHTIDHALVVATLFGISAPTFVTGLLLQVLFARELRVLPFDGFGLTPLDHLRAVILPALTLGLFGAAATTRLVRDELIVELGRDYVRTARAKGLGELAVTRHAVRNALVPLSTVVALDLGALASGAVVTESLFRWPGLGALSVNALLDRDGPVLLGTVLVTSLLVVTASFLADVAYVVLDPRVRRAA